MKPIAILYEHPEWFKPLFAALDRRGVDYTHLDATRLVWDATERESPYSLVVNRMSPSARSRGNAHAIWSSLHYLEHLDRIGANVLNGARAFRLELSKADQLDVFEELGVPYPAARVVNHVSQLAVAAEGLRFPVVIKPNIGGSGTGIVEYETVEQLVADGEAGAVDFGVDHTLLVQERLPAHGNRVVRVEVLDGRMLYAIALELEPGTFNLCPADYCRVPDAGADTEPAPEAPERSLIERVEPPAELARTAEWLVAAAGADVGGVEYLIDDRDGVAYFYDVNVLSNFVADAPTILGFDPHERLADLIVERAR